jgi:mRNA interferase MazF
VGQFVKGDIVVIPFPFSSTAGAKYRPALVLAALHYGQYADYIVCAITTKGQDDPHKLDITDNDLKSGALYRESSIRPTYITTTSETRIRSRIGTLNSGKIEEAVRVLVSVF